MQEKTRAASADSKLCASVWLHGCSISCTLPLSAKDGQPVLTVPLVTTVDSGEDCWCKTVPALGNVRDEAKKKVLHCTRLLSSGQQQQQNDCNMNSQVGRRRERESQARTRRQNKKCCFVAIERMGKQMLCRTDGRGGCGASSQQ